MAKRSPAETPLMRQFLEVKGAHPDAIVFFRCGDFYEMFFEDAVIASQKLDITLTTRDKGKEDAVPMCGFPHHAARGYVAKLTDVGLKVVLCEQVEDPKLAKGLVKREVVRIITPGVVLDEEMLDPKVARYVAAVLASKNGGWGLGYLDASTGEFRATACVSLEAMVSELSRIDAREVLALDGDFDGVLADVRRRMPAISWSAVPPLGLATATSLLEHELATSMKALGIADQPAVIQAAGMVLDYARATQPAGALPISRLQVYSAGETVVLDETAVANLELVTTLIGARKQGSLLHTIDETSTAPGGRLLRRWLLYPLAAVEPIRRRQDAVEYFFVDAVLRAEVRRALKEIHDLERLAGRATLGVATPRDMGRLRDSLFALPGLVKLLGGPAPSRAATGSLPALLAFDAKDLSTLAKLAGGLSAALVDEPPSITKDGGIVRAGFCRQVDEARSLADGGKDAILAIETRERERTGISTLKIKYNRVFGYYLEVTKSQLAKVPKDYVRKQTIANGERYVTTELAELEAKVLTAQEALLAREQAIFAELVADVVALAKELARTAERIALVDVCAGLAEVGHRESYVRPVVDDSEVIEIDGGRHPVVERLALAGSFVPNDCRLDTEREQVMLITGPNMAGKSTYMRQVAHIVLLAQLGAYVPASRARIGLCDRIFTRVGAADNLSRGDSTFMVEMRETAAILTGATRRSLVVLDEVGRGTSTFDGVSIAWAVTEFLHDAIGCRTLFATHYHELCALAETRPKIVNRSVAVREHKGEIVFLRQLVEGGASRSYGIDVARLAGLPRSAIARARQILSQLEGGASLGTSSQLSLFAAASTPAATPTQANPAERAVAEQLRAADPNAMTPLQALALLAELRDQLG